MSKNIKNPQHHKICVNCKKEFDTKFLQQKYCSELCRVRDRDKRVKQEMKEYKDNIYKQAIQRFK